MHVFFKTRMALKKQVFRLAFFGGDGGNRNRVRKLIPATFSERSL